MAISDTDLNDKIMGAFTGYNNGGYKSDPKHPQHLKILGDTMKDYFEKNTEISYGWAAVHSNSYQDPVKKFDSEVSFPSFDLTSAVDLPTLAALIQAAVLGGIISHAIGFNVSPGSFHANKNLSFPLHNTYGDNIFYEAIVKTTCAWVLTCINTSPLSGTHGSYTGATTSMEIK
jgi:hypothetical protein